MSLPINGTVSVVLLSGLSILLTVLFSLFYIRRYRNPYESELSTIIAAVISMTVALLTSALLPLDIFIVSFMKNPDSTFKEWAQNITQRNHIENSVLYSYYTLYSLIFFCIFILIPFMYFYYEERGEDGFSSEGRFCNALKYSTAITFVAVVLILFGAFIPLREAPSNNNSTDTNSTDWDRFKFLINDLSRNRGEDALSMVLSILSSLGVINVVIYTGFGISSLPISLIRGTKSATQQIENIQDSHLVNQTKINALRDRERIGSKLTSRERRQLQKLEENERLISRQEQHLLYYRSSLFYKLRKFLRPLQIVFGCVLAALSLLIWISLLLTNIDKAMHSMGMKMGYALPKRYLPNPIDMALVTFQRAFPLDYILVIAITFFFVMASVSGLRNLGMWFFVVRYKLRAQRTTPQALLMVCASLMLTVLGINILFYCISPQYATYGSQHYITNSSIIACSNDGTELGECTMTRASALLVRFFYKAWIFGAFYYWSMWAFIGISALSCIYVVIRPSRSATDGLIDEDDLEESDDDLIRP